MPPAGTGQGLRSGPAAEKRKEVLCLDLFKSTFFDRYTALTEAQLREKLDPVPAPGGGNYTGLAGQRLRLVLDSGTELDYAFGAETLTCCIDIPALVTYIKGEGSETFSKLDPQQFVSEWSKMYSGLEYKVEGPAFVTSAAIKGFKPKATVAERFAKTLPEAAGKPLSLVEVTSLYTILKAAAAQLADVCDEIKEFKPLIATLPDEGTGAIASASWREGGDLRYVARISSDEIKSLGATANIAIGAVMAQMMSAMSEEDDDEDCDCEDDEDDDD